MPEEPDWETLPETMTQEELIDFQNRWTAKAEGVHPCSRCGQLDERPMLVALFTMGGKTYLNLKVCRDCSTLQVKEPETFYRKGWEKIG